MIHRTFDADRLNEIANHPEVRGSLGGDGESWLDLSEVIADHRNVILLDEHGGFIFAWSAPGTYEVHVMILPEGRGEWGYQLARQAHDHMQALGADHLWARVQPSMRHLRHFTASRGFVKCGTDTVDLGAGPVEYDLFHWRKCTCRQP